MLPQLNLFRTGLDNKLSAQIQVIFPAGTSVFENATDPASPDRAAAWGARPRAESCSLK